MIPHHRITTPSPSPAPNAVGVPSGPRFGTGGGAQRAPGTGAARSRGRHDMATRVYTTRLDDLVSSKMMRPTRNHIRLIDSGVHPCYAFG